MLLPTSIDLLRCIERTLETVIAPRLTGAEERSAAATIGHLLRHVVLRIQHEGAMLFEDVQTLRALLDQVDGCLQAHHVNDDRADSLRSAIATALTRPVQPAGYRDVASLAAEVHEMRQVVSDSLVFIQDLEGKPAGRTADIHEALTRYVAWEVAQEVRLIDPAFEGFGPRR